jgi:hypothetical protein
MMNKSADFSNGLLILDDNRFGKTKTESTIKGRGRARSH